MSKDIVTIGYRMQDKAENLGVSADEARSCVIFCEVPAEEASKLTAAKGKTLPKFARNVGRCRLFNFEISPYYRGVWKGLYPWVRVTSLNEYLAYRGQLEEIHQSLKDRYVDENVPGADQKGRYNFLKKTQLRIWVGKPNQVPDDKKAAVLKRFSKGLHPYVVQKIESGEWDVYYMPPVAPVEAERPNMESYDATGEFLWKGEMVLDLYRIIDTLQYKQEHLCSYLKESQLSAPHSKEWGAREFKMIYTLTGGELDLKEKSNQILDDAVVIAATGFCFIQHRPGKRTVVVFVDAETMKWWLTSYFTDRCNVGLAARFNYVIGIPEQLMPKEGRDMLPRENTKAPEPPKKEVVRAPKETKDDSEDDDTDRPPTVLTGTLGDLLTKKGQVPSIKAQDAQS